jgi:hypothetical protein
MDQGGVSTSMDQLVELLEKSGTVKINDAAKELGVDKIRVESWARMLEKADVIGIHYSVIGGAILKRGPKFDSVIKKKKVETKEKELDVVKPKVEEEATPLTVKKAAPAKATELKETPKDFLLIKRKLDEEEDIVEADLKRLHEEEAKVVEYMKVLIGEGKKLTEYIETLREVVEQMDSHGAGKPAKASNSK